MNMPLNRTRPNGFTIVELLVVIVVIGILAAVITVAYNGIQKNATGALMKETVQSAGTKMKLANASTESYPTTLPSDLKSPAGIGLALTVVGTTSEFCINVTSQKYTDLQWHVDHTGVMQTGLCSGEIIVASIIGDYASSSTPTTVSSAVTVNGTIGGFKLQTNEAWSNLTLSWDAVSGATKYEIQTRTTSADSWAVRTTSDGGGSYSPTYSGAATVTNNIPSSTTSLVWTSSITTPRTAGGTQEFRYRSFVGSTASEWSTATLTAPSGAAMATVPTLTVTPNTSWANATLAWSSPIGLGSPANIVYELQTRTSNAASWYSRDATDGGGSYDANYNGATTTTNNMPLSTLGLTWTSSLSVPKTTGLTYEYRIRVKSTISAAIYGPWTNFSLSVPAFALPSPTNFTVVPTSDFSSIALSWTAPSNFGTPDSILYDVQTRTNSSASWYARALSDGSGSYAGTYAGATLTSNNTPLTTTTATWTSSLSKPATGTTHEYRIRVRSTAASGIFSDWTTTTLSR